MPEQCPAGFEKNIFLMNIIAMTLRLGLTRIALKSFHLPMESTEVEIKEIANSVRNAGLDLYGCGVVYMTSEDAIDI